MAEILSPEVTTLLPVSEVLAVQGLAMGYVRERARRVRTAADKRAHRFMFYQASGAEMGSGEIDTFMGVSVTKPDFRRWRMIISFLELELTEDRRYSNFRETFEFDWSAGTDCFGIKRSKEMFNMIVGSRVDPELGVIDTVQPLMSEDIEPLAPDDLDALCERMISVTEAVKQAA